MEDGITYKDLMTSSVFISQIIDLQIIEKPGCHSTLYLTAVYNPLLIENAFYELEEVILVGYQKGKKTKMLFMGIVVKSSLIQQGEERLIEIYLEDSTYYMDLYKQTRCFQNTKTTVKTVIQEVMKGYGATTSLIHIPDQQIGELVLQYQETDWEFLNRFLSNYHEYCYPSAISQKICIQAGIGTQQEEVDWDQLPCTQTLQGDQWAYLSRNGHKNLVASQFISYEIQSYDVVSVGSQVRFHGTAWCLASAVRTLQNGLLINYYQLKQKKAMWRERYYNTQLTGISIQAQVAKVNRDKVQVQLAEDLLYKQGSYYWFTFSSVSSSSDGGGWYCMPEIKDSVRVYFPTEKERDAYVITSLGANQGQSQSPSSGSSASNPKDKSIQTAQGNLVKFHENGVTLEAQNGGAQIALNKDGSIVITGPEGIDLSASKQFSLSAKTITIKSDTKIKLTSDAGADITIKSDKIKLHGKKIFEN